ncbi:deoxyribodipyrimidine photo-lyase [Maribellus sp. YY47]|uniref:cryptochrome/photolyase family protein n=1 Tax=Maribellus sp. YY47 TaxID=2929486 RepID=UPI002000C8FA|nr:deoxyribodipyrimidine photo-lyase [Maribellus sp. YY47]MCK3685078.1 DNA photolyase family protein [Maribellus sp. YY47]
MNAVFWFRRDLRLEDNTALIKALAGKLKVIPLFIFDSNILEELPKDDARLTFIYAQLQKINAQLKEIGSGLLIKQGNPSEVWEEVIQQFQVKEVYFNKDYEPYAIRRDEQVTNLLSSQNISVFPFKDQVIFEESEVMKPDGECYTVFTPYKNKWLQHFTTEGLPLLPKTEWANFEKTNFGFPSLNALGFSESSITVKDVNFSVLENYEQTRNLPALEGTSNLSVHLRFGTVSIREIVRKVADEFPVFLNELIWREFFMQILFHYPKVVHQNFRSKYDGIQWRNNEKEFERWCAGDTGYPMVDAGMRELNQTGYMHNRVRMVTASFLCKHLLIDWRWGETYFAKKLLDYELSSNNGNWQWAAGTGCDAAPYFRVFNPSEQQKKFDPKLSYIKHWIPELETFNYPLPMVEHSFARKRALETYQRGIIQ